MARITVALAIALQLQLRLVLALPPRTRARPAHDRIVFHLRAYCRSPTCEQRAIAHLTSNQCTHVHLHRSLRVLQATCHHARLPQVLSTPRFRPITTTPPLHLLSATHFAHVTSLSFPRAAASARAPGGRAVPLTAPRRARCSRRRGAGVTVYVVDTGCRSTHEQLSGRVRVRVAPGAPFASPDDDHGHGTHVAATIAGRDFGIAPSARVVCIKALSHRNEGSAKDVIAAIRLAIRMHRRRARRVAVISVSLGVRADRRYRALDRAVADAAQNGLITVVAAGNAGRDACTFTPARAESAVTVAAVGADGVLARFSNWGDCVAVGAPGVAVWSALADGDRMYGVSSGTSMAAPFVSGLVALRLSEAALPIAEIKPWLREISRMKQGLPVVSVSGFCAWMKTTGLQQRASGQEDTATKRQGGRGGAMDRPGRSRRPTRGRRRGQKYRSKQTERQTGRQISK